MKPGHLHFTRSVLPLVLYLGLAGIMWLILGRTNEPDANFVAYRFASNLASGRGLVYWTPGAPVSTYPLVPALLALPALAGMPLPVAGGILSIFAAGVGAFCLARLSGKNWLAGAAYILVAMVQPSPVVLMMVALALAGLDAARQNSWDRAGIWIGLAILSEPSAVGLAILMLFALARLDGSIGRYLVPVGLSIAELVLLAGLSHAPLISVVPGVVTVTLPLAGVLILIWRWSRLRDLPLHAVLLAWSALVALAALAARTLPTAAIVPGLITVATLTPRPALALVCTCADMLIGILVAGQFAAPSSAEALGQWIAANTKPGATVAAADTGALAFYADRPLIDLGDKIQPDALDPTFFLRHAPDAIVLQPGQAVPWQAFTTTYAQTYVLDDRAVYQPVVHFSPLDDHRVNVNYGVSSLGRSDLRLTNVAISTVLRPGDLVRIRLDWEFDYRPSNDIRIRLALFSAQEQPIVEGSDLVPQAAWQHSTMSTYHLLVLPADAGAGKVSLHLGSSLGGGVGPDLIVAVVNVAR